MAIIKKEAKGCLHWQAFLLMAALGGCSANPIVQSDRSGQGGSEALPEVETHFAWRSDWIVSTPGVSSSAESALRRYFSPPSLAIPVVEGRSGGIDLRWVRPTGYRVSFQELDSTARVVVHAGMRDSEAVCHLTVSIIGREIFYRKSGEVLFDSFVHITNQHNPIMSRYRGGAGMRVAAISEPISLELGDGLSSCGYLSSDVANAVAVGVSALNRNNKDRDIFILTAQPGL